MFNSFVIVMQFNVLVSFVQILVQPRSRFADLQNRNHGMDGVAIQQLVEMWWLAAQP